MCEQLQRPEAFTSRWDESIQSYDVLLEKSSKSELESSEPVELEIMYSAGIDCEKELVHEVVYVDRANDPEELQGPRLLVSVKAVSALRRICQADFERYQGTLAILNECRGAYYKELIYLREQLKRLKNKGVIDPMDDHVENYECYWYNPPVYLDEELRDFLLTCIRLTNKKVIEENYRLVRILQDQGNDSRMDDDKKLKALMRGFGAGGLVRKIGGFVRSGDVSKQQSEDFMNAIHEILAKEKHPHQKSELDKKTKEIAALQAELEKLRIACSENDEIRAALEASSLVLEQRLAAETARAEDAKKRAEDAERQTQELQAHVKDIEVRLADEQRRQAGKNDSDAEQGQLILKALPSACDRILGIAAQIDSKILSKRSMPIESDGVARLNDAVMLLDKAWKAAQLAKGKIAERETQVDDGAFRNPKDAENAELADLKVDFDKLRARLAAAIKDSKESVEAMEQLNLKLSLRDERIAKLKAEIRRLKLALGEPDEEDDDADDEDLPDFLLCYWRRVRGVAKPRWMHLSEDAACKQVKRTYDCSALRHDAVEARIALAFLSRKENAVRKHPSTAVVPHTSRRDSSPSRATKQDSINSRVLALQQDLSQTVAEDEMRKITPRPLFDNSCLTDPLIELGAISGSMSPAIASVNASRMRSRSPLDSALRSSAFDIDGARSPPITIRTVVQTPRSELRLDNGSLGVERTDNTFQCLSKVVSGVQDSKQTKAPVGEHEQTARLSHDTYRSRAVFAGEDEPTARQPQGERVRSSGGTVFNSDVKRRQTQKPSPEHVQGQPSSPTLAPLHPDQAEITTDRSRKQFDKSQPHPLLIGPNAVPKPADGFSRGPAKVEEIVGRSDKLAEAANLLGSCRTPTKTGGFGSAVTGFRITADAKKANPWKHDDIATAPSQNAGFSKAADAKKASPWKHDDSQRPATAPSQNAGLSGPSLRNLVGELANIPGGIDSSGGVLGLKKHTTTTKFPRALSAGTVRAGVQTAAKIETPVLRPSLSVGCRRVLPFTNVGRCQTQTSDDEGLVRTILPGVSQALPPGRVRKSIVK